MNFFFVVVVVVVLFAGLKTKQQLFFTDFVHSVCLVKAFFSLPCVCCIYAAV